MPFSRFPWDLLPFCSETPGDRRGTVGDNTEGLGMGTLETETQEIGDTTAPSDGVSDSSGRRLSWKNSGRWPRLVSVLLYRLCIILS